MQNNESKEMYIKAIYNIYKTNGVVHNIDIANYLNLSKPSVTIALKKLSDQNLLQIDEDNHVWLTDDGLKIANGVSKKFTMLKDLLKKVGVPDDKASNAACKIEHAIDDDIYTYLRLWLDKY